MRILIAEDDIELNRRLCKTLQAEGYGVDGCLNGKDALEYVAGIRYDLIIMDVMMPGTDGLATVEQMRLQGVGTPILFLSARSGLEDKVKGLEVGGDYYLTKPFQIPELLAVIRAMLRKYADHKTDMITVADLTVDLSMRTVARGGCQIHLTVREFALLEYMIRNKGMVLSRKMIEQHLWNYDYEGGTNVIDVYVGYLRKKIDTGHEKKLIHTVWGIGWKLDEV